MTKTKVQVKPAKQARSFADFEFEAGRDYRVSFRNGQSGEFHGQALQYCAPFDFAQVVSIDVMPLPPVEG